MSPSALFSNYLSVSQPQLTLQSLGIFLKTAVAEPHQPDQLNQKPWGGRQALVFFLTQVILLCARQRITALTLSEFTTVLVPHSNDSQTSLLPQAPALSLIPSFLADGYSSSSLFQLIFCSPSSLPFLFHENMCIPGLSHSLHSNLQLPMLAVTMLCH